MHALFSNVQVLNLSIHAYLLALNARVGDVQRSVNNMSGKTSIVMYFVEITSTLSQ